MLTIAGGVILGLLGLWVLLWLIGAVFEGLSCFMLRVRWDFGRPAGELIAEGIFFTILGVVILLINVAPVGLIALAALLAGWWMIRVVRNALIKAGEEDLEALVQAGRA